MIKWEKEATESSIRFMNLLLEEEKINLAKLELQLKEQIDITKRFEHEVDYCNNEKQLQGTIERFHFQKTQTVPTRRN